MAKKEQSPFFEGGNAHVRARILSDCAHFLHEKCFSSGGAPGKDRFDLVSAIAMTEILRNRTRDEVFDNLKLPPVKIGGSFSVCQKFLLTVFCGGSPCGSVVVVRPQEILQKLIVVILSLL